MINYTGPMTYAALLATTMMVGGCSKPPDAPEPTPAPTASVANVSDIDVTEHVTTALRRSEVLKGFDINVVTLKGDVRLTGMLDSQAQVDEAIMIARASEGTHAIHDELTLKK
jgi:osmotically-inducible protein OsmY